MTAGALAISIREIFLPRTDAGAIAQVAIAIPLLCALVFRHRRNPEMRTFALGLLVLSSALFALRTVH